MGKKVHVRTVAAEDHAFFQLARHLLAVVFIIIDDLHGNALPLQHGSQGLPCAAGADD